MARTSRMIQTAQGTAPEEARLDAAEAAAHLAVSTRLIGAGDPELAAFFTGFTRYASPEDLIHYTGAELAALVKLVFARTVVRDWKPRLACLAETTAGLKRNPPPVAADELAENLAFLEWLAADHFTFLGCRDYVFSSDTEGRLDPDPASGLGLLADPEMRVVRRGADRSILTPEVRDFLTQPVPLIISKSALRSTVHRRVHMDYVGAKIFDAEGKLTGERRF